MDHLPWWEYNGLYQRLKERTAMDTAGQRILTDADLKKTYMQGIADRFADLGKPENIGNAFAITRRALHLAEVKGDTAKFVSRLPRPDYEHGIWHDTATDNLIVIRPNKDGCYALEELTGAGSKFGKRLR